MGVGSGDAGAASAYQGIVVRGLRRFPPASTAGRWRRSSNRSPLPASSPSGSGPRRGSSTRLPRWCCARATSSRSRGDLRRMSIPAIRSPAPRSTTPNCWTSRPPRRRGGGRGSRWWGKTLGDSGGDRSGGTRPAGACSSVKSCGAGRRSRSGRAPSWSEATWSRLVGPAAQVVAGGAARRPRTASRHQHRLPEHRRSRSRSVGWEGLRRSAWPGSMSASACRSASCSADSSRAGCTRCAPPWRRCPSRCSAYSTRSG